ncbi:organic cation/carnitine transporter 2-like [Elaeis guineensis]|uniref:H(+)/Pi cotransporter n=1 Tax=Elaeis guineensis var. tenera TaxID=51953 RepID=A0A6J0PLY1_ELAGV|nr:organic cation/carnitine transporter 2-like [Elaeis guineensis]
MDNSTPLLPCRSSDAQFQPETKKKAVDDAIESCIGATGLAQLLRAIFVSLAWAFDSQQTFINVFTDAEPSWHCTRADDPLCSSALHPCGLPQGSWAWDHPEHASVVSEWSLECSGSAITGLPASAFFAGSLIGGLVLAPLADSLLGRKNMLFLSCLTMSLTGTLTAVSPNFWVYVSLRFICGFGRATVNSCALVLSTEMVAKRWRDRISIVGFFCFTLGFLSLPAVAYVEQGSSWRTLYAWISVPSFCYSILIHFLIQESPRWLLVRGRREEAIQTLKSIAASNGNIIDSSFSGLLTMEETRTVGTFAAMKMLWEKRWAFRRLAAIMTVGFGLGMVYFGMPLNLGNLGSNLYLSVTFNALAELPAALLTFFLVERMDRRSSLLVFTAISGVCSILCMFLRVEELRMAVEVVSFFSACTAFNVALIYSIELFPTCLRNSAISIVRQAITLGGTLAPILVGEGRRNSSLSFGVFGLVIAGCGLFSACLPETRGTTICDTMEEEESKEISSSTAAHK